MIALMRVLWCSVISARPRFLFMALEGGESEELDPDTAEVTDKGEGLSATIKKLFAGRLMNYIEVGLQVGSMFFF